MVFLDLANILQTKIIYIFAYFPVVTLVGFLQSWINSKLGDDTAKNWGFLTLDPAVHFDTYGFFVLVFPWQLLGIDLNIGFGKLIPYNPESLYGRFIKLRKLIILFSSFISAFLCSIFFGFITNIVLLFSKIIISQVGSSFFLALLMMAEGMLMLSASLSFIYFVVNLVDALLYKFDKNDVIKSNVFLRFLIVIGTAILLSHLIRSSLILLLGSLYSF